MSYILDALKKSEQERGHGNVPGVQTIHSASISYRDDKRSWWPYILITAVLLNIAVIIFFNMDRFETQRASPDTAGPLSSQPVENESAIQAGMSATATSAKNHQAMASQQTDVQNEPPATTASSQANPGNRSASVENAASDSKADDDNTEDWEMITPATTQYSPPASQQNQGDTANTDSAYAPVAAIAEPTGIIDYNELPESIKTQLPAIIISAHVYSSNPSQRSIVINNDFMEEGEYLIDDMVLHEITREGAVLNYRGILFHYGAVSSWQ